MNAILWFLLGAYLCGACWVYFQLHAAFCFDRSPEYQKHLTALVCAILWPLSIVLTLVVEMWHIVRK